MKVLLASPHGFCAGVVVKDQKTSDRRSCQDLPSTWQYPGNFAASVMVPTIRRSGVQLWKSIDDS